MNKKGFTLVELLGVITVLAVIGLITMPIVNKTIKDSKQRAYNGQVEEIIKAAEDYSADNISKIPDGESNCPSTSPLLNLYIDTLKEEGYIPENAKDPRTNTLLTGGVIITYDCEYKSYIYTYDPNLVKP